MIYAATKQHFPKALVLTLLLLGSLVVVGLTPFVGASDVSLHDVLSGDDPIHTKVFWQMRMPRVLVAFFVGATFAICGMVFQALFRNPLVAPSTLGVSAGASFGAAIYIWLGFSFSILGISGVSFFAFAGAILSIGIVWYLSSFSYGTSTSKLLLAGVAVSFFFVSLIMFIQYLSDISQSFRITRWLMGSLHIFGYETLWDVMPLAIIGLILVWFFTNELNLFMTSEEIAISRGVDVNLMIRILFLLISFIIGGIVAVCGPISFVGIIAPHICRLLIGSDHRYLTPATFLFGGLFLTLCDALARTIVAPGEIPVGIITAILGGPFFLWLLRTR